MNEVKSIFEPKSVVVIGSSKIREEVGMASPQLFKNVAYNLRRHFQGETFTLDLESKDFPTSLSKLRPVPELAVLTLPPLESIKQARECARIGVKALIMITGGYTSKQRQLLSDIKNKYGTRVLGPNTIMGVVNTANKLNTTFERNLMPEKGNIAFISQSGGVGACLLDWARFHRVGISKFAFTGDKIDVDDVDLIRYYGNDSKTNVICLYMEGMRDGRRFIEESRRVVRKKPILALKGGTTRESAQRAKSHTASMAGSDMVFDAAFRKAGIVRVQDIEELMDSAIALSKQPPLCGDNIAIVSNVGGPAILAGDALVKHGLKIARLSDNSRHKIEKHYPGVTADNPIDLIADAKAERYEKVLDIVLADENVDGVLIINMLKSTFFKPSDATVIAKVARKYSGKPIVDVPAGGEDFALVQKILENTRVPLFNLPDKAVKALRTMRAYGRILEKR